MGLGCEGSVRPLMLVAQALAQLLEPEPPSLQAAPTYRRTVLRSTPASRSMLRNPAPRSHNRSSSRTSNIRTTGSPQPPS